MAKAISGNHSSVIVPRQDRESIRKFYCDVLGGTLTKEEAERDFLRLGDDFYIGFLYGDVPDESEFLRTARSAWLEIKSDNVEEMKRKILDFGVRKIEVPDPHLYFQAPGGQVLRLVGIDEDLSFYEGAGAGPDVAKVKEALKKEATNLATPKTLSEGIAKTVTVNVSPEKLFQAVSTPAGLRGWWCKVLTGDAETDGVVHLEFVGSRHKYRIRIERAREPTLAQWRVEKHNLWKEWDGTAMVFTISPAGSGKSKLDFLHAGLTPKCECYGATDGAWSYMMESIKDYVEQGKGKPA